MGARPVLVALFATVVTGCLIRPSGVKPIDAAPQADSGGGGGGGGGMDAGGGGGGGEAGMDAAIDAGGGSGGGMDAGGEGGVDAGITDPCAMATAVTGISPVCTGGATASGNGATENTASAAGCTWHGVALTGTFPNVAVRITRAPSSALGHAALQVSDGTMILSIRVTDDGGLFVPTADSGWGSNGSSGAGTTSSLCIRIANMPDAIGAAYAEYYDSVTGWQPFAQAPGTLASPVNVTLGNTSAGSASVSAVFDELGTGSP